MKIYTPLKKGEVPRAQHTKPVLVAESLDNLVGKSDGTIVLPIYLDWTPCNYYDLSNIEDVRRLYMTVLNEATSTNDLHVFLHKDSLIEIWGIIHLPRHVRAAWESVHPELKDSNGT
ncbi:MAG: hypothetical protein FWE46_04580 [Coriobacteriia bacterium]|nr:hypothetical protein [Coriobacteriia bacterium]